MQLKDQQVVIIGGSSGIGLATAQLAQAEGARVTITGRSEEKLRRVANTLGTVKTAIADVTNEKDLQQVFEACDRVDHLVLLGASLASGKICDAALEDLSRPITERLWGAIHTIRAAAPKMSNGSITLTSGLFSARPIAGMAVVAAAVGGIEAMTRALALELAPIRINAIAPGYIDTPLLRAAFEDQYEGVVKAQSAVLPTQRIGTAEETAKAILFLMTSGFITGEILHIDGGGRLI
ncbi:MAG: SDR family oxidoreductase [Oculatellaceae cyanobacterium Prado106]|nr:SDR family oxidoreductase [Oculatellaceae cyanobacterium Prado106]